MSDINDTQSAQSNSTMEKKNLFPVSSLVIIFIILALGGWYFWNKNNNQVDPNVATRTLPLAFEDLDPSQIPPGFPKDLPMSKGAEVLQNKTLDIGGGEVRSIRELQTTQSIEQEFNLYNDYFRKNGWPITTVTTESNLKYFFVDNADPEKYVTQRLAVTISASGGKTIVNLSLTTRQLTASQVKTVKK